MIFAISKSTINKGKLPGIPAKVRNRKAALFTLPLITALWLSAQTGGELLDQADRIAESLSLAKAQPLYRKAEIAANLAGDSANELRAKLGQIRFRVQQGSYTSSRRQLKEFLGTPS